MIYKISNFSKKNSYGKFFRFTTFFYFRCLINLNDNYLITVKKIKVSPINITLFHRLLYRITTSSTKTLLLHENLTGTKIKISISS